MCRSKIFLMALSTLLFLSACSTGAAAGQASPAVPTSTPTAQQTATSTLLPPTSTANRKAEIIREINQKAADFNQFIEAEKKSGVTTGVTLENGKPGIAFVGSSYMKVQNADDLVRQQIAALNQEYYELYLQERQSAATATLPPDREQRQALADKVSAEFETWLQNEFEHGATVTLYTEDVDRFTQLLIGESYVLDKEKESEMSALDLSLKVWPAPDLVKLDIQMIQNLEPGDVTLTDIGAVPYYSLNHDLTHYETKTRLYLVYSNSHDIIEITPKDLPQGSELTPLAPLGEKELEQKARAFVALASPKVNLDGLTFAMTSKVETFFFRWEDHTKVLDDGSSYPYVQVGFSRDGELLNYYNTLPLAR